MLIERYICICIHEVLIFANIMPIYLFMYVECTIYICTYVYARPYSERTNNKCLHSYKYANINEYTYIYIDDNRKRWRLLIYDHINVLAV